MKKSPPSYDPVPGWGESLFTGAAGIALLHIEYARTGAGDWDTAHQWGTAMIRNPVTAHPDVCQIRPVADVPQRQGGHLLGSRRRGGRLSRAGPS